MAWDSSRPIPWNRLLKEAAIFLVLGAVIFSYLQIKLLAIPALRDSYLFLYGGLLILVMLFEPKGIVGLWGRLVAALRRTKETTGESRAR